MKQLLWLILTAPPIAVWAVQEANGPEQVYSLAGLLDKVGLPVAILISVGMAIHAGWQFFTKSVYPEWTQRFDSFKSDLVGALKENLDQSAVQHREILQAVTEHDRRTNGDHK